ncbi:MAG: hypothetical protein ABL879_16710 [Devosia sp.]
MQIQKRTMGWLPRPSLYNEAEAARLKNKSMHQDFLSTQSSFASSIGSIQSNFSTEQGVLIGNMAAKRLGMKTA